MLLFSTVLSIKDMTKDDFISLAIEWNQQSSYEENIIPDIKWHGERNIRFGSERCFMDIAEYKEKNIEAIRYVKQDVDGVIWSTDYVMDFSSMKMSIRLDRSYLESSLRINTKFSTPHFISMLIEKDYIKPDGDLKTERTPLLINEENINILSDIINGKRHYALPVVYVSAAKNGKYPVDIKLLAGKLKGAAHVLAQKSISLNEHLRTLCDDKNEYFGAIGIYFPNAEEHKKFIYHGNEDYDENQFEKVIRTVIQHGNAQRTDVLFTWQGVKNAILMSDLSHREKEYNDTKQALKNAEDRQTEILKEFDEKKQELWQQARADAEEEENKLLEGVDEELAKLKNQIKELTHANEILEYENQGFKAKLDSSDNSPVLFEGEETDFYPGEIKDIILTVLSDILENTAAGSRRYDVIKDIIEHNDFKNSSKTKADRIKKLLNNYTDLTPPLRQALADLGFTITDDGKHYKLTYYGDGRYTTALSKTPSDVRTGKNSAKYINEKAF